MKKFALMAAVFLMMSGNICLGDEPVTDDSYSPSDQKISMYLQNVPIASVLTALGHECDLNLVTSNAVQGRITIAVKDVSAYEALLAVIRASGYSHRIENGIIRINGGAAGNLGESTISHEKGIVTKAFVTNNLSSDDLKEMLTKFEYENTKVLSSKDSNVIVVECPAATMDKVQKIIGRMNASPNQVLVESQIMEITAGNAANPTVFGTKAKYTGTSATAQTEGFANPATLGTPGFYAHVVKGGVDAYVETLANNEGFNLLANPKVVAISGKPANIISGQKLGYKTTLTTTTGTMQNVDFLEVGTKLSFTPYILSDGTIRMEIHPEVSEGQVTTDGLPQKQTTEASTTVIVRDGETIIIGGLIKNKTKEVSSGVPFLMDIPLFGNAFKRKEILFEKKEIIAILTPHIITGAKMKQMVSEIEDMKQRQNDANIGNPPDTWWWLK